jgi:hypothetical protein
MDRESAMDAVRVERMQSARWVRSCVSGRLVGLVWLVKGGAGAPHSILRVLVVMTAVKWCALERLGHEMSSQNGTDGGIPPVFWKSAQRVRNQCVGNIPKSGVCKRLKLLGMREGVER